MTQSTLQENFRKKSLAAVLLMSLMSISLPADPENAELIANGDFQNGQTSWILEVIGSVNATLTIVNEAPDNKPAASITVPNDNSGELWLVSFKQTPIAIVQGKSYRLTLEMKASKDTSAFVGLKQDASPYAKISGIEGKQIDLTDQWQDISYDFTAGGSEAGARLYFTNLNQPGVTWYLTHISLKEVTGK